MAWEKTEWSCGHSGAMQLYGKQSGRDYIIASQAGRKCMACWLVGQWEAQNDPRARREDRYVLAGKIAEGKGKRIYGLPETAPINVAEAINPLADVSTDDLIAELERRNITINKEVINA